MVKMKDKVTDSERVLNMIGTCILHKKQNKIFPLGEEGARCAVICNFNTNPHTHAQLHAHAPNCAGTTIHVL